MFVSFSQYLFLLQSYPSYFTEVGTTAFEETPRMYVSKKIKDLCLCIMFYEIRTCYSYKNSIFNLTLNVINLRN